MWPGRYLSWRAIAFSALVLAAIASPIWGWWGFASALIVVAALGWFLRQEEPREAVSYLVSEMMSVVVLVVIAAVFVAIVASPSSCSSDFDQEYRAP